MSIKNKSYYPWIIWLLAAGFFFAEYFARVAPSVMVNDLMAAFRVHALSLGALSAFFYYAYVGMQLPVGTMIDRFGPHKLLTVMAALCGISCFVFSHSTSIEAAALARLFMGFAAAFAFVGALKLASTWFPARRFGLMAGATQALGMLGAAVGEGPVAVMVTHIGWRESMMVIGLILLGLAILIGLLVRDRPAKQKKIAYTPQPLLSNLWVVLKNPQTWINGLVVGCLYAPTAAFAELWGADYFQHIEHIPTDIAAGAISMIFIGWAISSPCVGALSDMIGRRKPIIIGSVIASMIALSIALYVPGIPVWGIYCLMFLYGASNVGVATCYAVACEHNPRPVAGTSMAFANMASVIIGASFQPIIGSLLDLGWDHRMFHHAPLYSTHDFRMAMLALPACFIASLIACVFLKETLSRTQSTTIAANIST